MAKMTIEDLLGDIVIKFQGDTSLSLQAAVRIVLEGYGHAALSSLYGRGVRAGHLWCGQALHNGSLVDSGVKCIVPLLMARPEIARVAAVRPQGPQRRQW